MKNILELYNKLNKKQKQILFISTFIFVIFGALVISFSFQTKEIEVDEIIANVHKSEMREVSEELKKNKIAFKIENGKSGSFNIITSSEASDEARLILSTINIKTERIRGWSIFDKSSLGKSTFENKVNFIRAVEGEIEKSLENIINIHSAKVNISEPKESLFIDRSKDTKVSVILVIEDNKKLNRKQILGIKSFISNSIAELDINNVELIDQTGFSLVADDEEITLSKGDEQLKYKKRIEMDLEAKLVDVISPVVGGNSNINIKLNLDISFKHEEINKEFFDPNNVIRSEKNMELSEKMNSSKKDIKGVPGAISNIQKKPNIPSKINGQVKNRDKSDSTVNYEVSSTKTISKNRDYGTINNIGVSVSFNTAPFQGNQLQTIQEKIERLVKGTINFNPERGDKVAVEGFEYFVYTETTKEIIPEPKLYEIIEGNLSKYSFLIKFIILSLLLYLFYTKIISKMREIKISEEEEEEENNTVLQDFRRNKEIELEEKKLLDEEERIRKEKERKHLAKLQLEEKIRGEIENLNSLSVEDETKYSVLLEKLKATFDDKDETISKLLVNLVENIENEKK